MDKYLERAKSIYDAASVYSRAAYLLSTQGGMSLEDHSLLLPSVVNAALSLELYFKSLYLIEIKEDFKVNNKHSHDFQLLYTKLSAPIRREIEAEFSKQIKKRDMQSIKQLEILSGMQTKLDLQSNIKDWSCVFVKMRYFFDKNAPPCNMSFFPEIEKALQNTIKRLKPDW